MALRREGEGEPAEKPREPGRAVPANKGAYTAAQRRMERVRMHVAVPVAAAVLVALFFASFMIGQYPIEPAGVLNIIGSRLFGFECSEPSMA